jgi:hypothetical protein
MSMGLVLITTGNLSQMRLSAGSAWLPATMTGTG